MPELDGQEPIRQSAEILKLRLARLRSERDRLQQEIERVESAVATLLELLTDAPGVAQPQERMEQFDAPVRVGDSPEADALPAGASSLAKATALDAAVFALSALGRPMSVEEIAEAATREGYRRGAKPDRVRGSITAALGRANRDGDRVRRVRTGVYGLLSWGPEPGDPESEQQSLVEDAEYTGPVGAPEGEGFPES